MKVFVYYNLHKHCWSVKNTKTGKIIMHADVVQLKDVVFKVSEAGRQRVLREKRKNVHAGVVGILVGIEHPFKPTSESQVISYNPYKGPEFINLNTLEPIKKAEKAVMAYGKVYI